MNLYDNLAIENQIEKYAADNDGEIPQELLEQLVVAETSSIQQIEGLCKYLRTLELGIEACQVEKDRISRMQEKAQNRIENIKRYMTPYIEKAGKIDAGLFKLSIRKSERTVITNEKAIPAQYITIVSTSKINKDDIKKELKSGRDVPGAHLEEHSNLQIK